MPVGCRSCVYLPEEAPTMRRTIVKYCSIPARIEATSRRLRADQRGVAGLVTAIAATVLLGFCGLAIDVIMWQVSQRGLQGAADQAALGGVTAYRNAGETAALGDSQTAKNGAYATAIQSGYPAASVTVAAYNNAGTCTNDGCLQVTITQTQPRYFTAIFLSQDVAESASAVGTCSGCGNGSFPVSSTGGDACVMALDTSGAGVITASGNSVLSLVKCNLYNNSPDTSATIMNGGANIEGCSATNACGSRAFLAQPDIPSNSSHIDIPIVTNAAPAPDPYANLVPPTPAESCAGFPANPVPSGTYCPGNINNASINFGTGAVIIITGGLSTKGNSTLAGTGVTLYVQGGGSLNANATLSISAPTTGPYAGIVLWFGDGAAVKYAGGNSSSFQGAIYAPESVVTYTGNAVSASTCTRLVSASLALAGTANATFDNSGCPILAGPVLTQSGVINGPQYAGLPMLVQ
jgi:Flp pilus assembly protein TadG